jgi:Protein of unknown function (DUF2752)
MTSSSPRSSRNRLYAGVAALGVAGGAWLLCAGAVGGAGTVCPFKLVTGFACPACGSTRAVLALFEGKDPLQYNPVGLVTLAAGTFALVLMLRDLATGSDRLLRVWGRAEAMIRRPPVALASIALLGANWIWTLSKGL